VAPEVTTSSTSTTGRAAEAGLVAHRSGVDEAAHHADVADRSARAAAAQGTRRAPGHAQRGVVPARTHAGPARRDGHQEHGAPHDSGDAVDGCEQRRHGTGQADTERRRKPEHPTFLVRQYGGPHRTLVRRGRDHRRQTGRPG
jgi:hypothetical protein